MFWSNVCVLGRQEVRHVEEAAKRLREKGIELTTTFFGLGQEEGLAEFVSRTEETADLMISTDLTMFEDERIFGTFRERLIPARELRALKPCVADSSIACNPLLLPVLVIPLVMVVNRACWGERPLPLGFADIVEERKSYGGRDNSAGKGLNRQLAALYGDAFMESFNGNADVFEMPVQAFQAVQKGRVPVSIVPTLFAMRADDTELAVIYPKEGAVTVPSFLAVRDTVSMELAKDLIEAIFPAGFCDFYAENGHIFPCFKGCADTGLTSENGFRFLYQP